MKLFKFGSFHINSVAVAYIREPVIPGGEWTISLVNGREIQARQDDPVLKDLLKFFRIEYATTKPTVKLEQK